MFLSNVYDSALHEYNITLLDPIRQEIQKGEGIAYF